MNSKKNNKTSVGNKTINQINQSQFYKVDHTNNALDLGQLSPSCNTGPGDRASSNYRQIVFDAQDNHSGPNKPGPYYEDHNSNRYYGGNHDEGPNLQIGQGQEDPGAQNRGQAQYGPGDRPQVRSKIPTVRPSLCTRGGFKTLSSLRHI